MTTPVSQPTPPRFTVSEPAAHRLHECLSAQEFLAQFEATTARSLGSISGQVIADEAPRAVFLVGSLPLGIGSSTSDIDLLVLVDDRSVVRRSEGLASNTDQRLEFTNDADTLLAGMFVSLQQGILIDLQVAVTPTVSAIYQRLRRRGPELNEVETRTLGRLSTGWLLWQTPDYLERHGLALRDPALGVYCATKHFVSALIHHRKASNALARGYVPLVLELARTGVEAAYLAYLASEGLNGLGSKWLAQLGIARDATERLTHHPVLAQGIPLLFPHVGLSMEDTAHYLERVRSFIASIRALIEQKLLYRIAFKACPQIDVA